MHESGEAAGEGHVPVLYKELLDFLRPMPGGRYLDGTVGLGGHASGVLEAAGGRAELLGLDRDENALAVCRRRLENGPGRAILRHLPFSRFEEALDELGWDFVDGAYLDVGVSSLQLEDPERGFSFQAEGPLDMRMDASGMEESAAFLVNRAGEDELKKIIGRLGEEPMGGRIARAVIKARNKKPIETTRELAEIILGAYPAGMRATARRHPATRTFQALRMAVNRELEELEDFLPLIVDRLRPGARLAVISFHSLEDRIVKRFVRDQARSCVCPLEQPLCTCKGYPRLAVLTKKPVTPGEEELEDNPRARSAKLRAAERLAEEAA
jgi:16S rRNA (cytosine1402-N4)-methyltransferase